MVFTCSYPEKDMSNRHKSKSRAPLRLCAATIGTSAVLAMAAIGLMVAHEHDGFPAANSPSMSVGSESPAALPPEQAVK